MNRLPRLGPAAIALVLAFLTSSCSIKNAAIGLLRHSKFPIKRRNQVVKGEAPPLLKATRDELNDRIARIYDPIASFSATVTLTPSVGSVYQSKVDEFTNLNGYVLFRKPYDIRIQAKTPVVGTTVFDMVADAERFRLQLNSKSLFATGLNDSPANSPNRMENLRPQAFLSSMLIRPADKEKETAVIEDDTDENDALYRLGFLRKSAKGEWVMGRVVYFDRIDLSITRQKVLDDQGLIVSDTRYAKWQMFGDILFPGHIDINRPEDGYGVEIDVVKMSMNKELSASDFVLEKPEGFQERTIGGPAGGRAQQ